MKITNSVLTLVQKAHIMLKHPTPTQHRSMLLAAGVVLISQGATGIVYAQQGGNVDDIRINQTVFAQFICALLAFLEGAFGALIMVIAGIGAVVSAAFGQYKAAISLVVVAVGAFVIRNLVESFFPGVVEQCTKGGVGNDTVLNEG